MRYRELDSSISHCSGKSEAWLPEIHILHILNCMLNKYVFSLSLSVSRMPRVMRFRATDCHNEEARGPLNTRARSLEQRIFFANARPRLARSYRHLSTFVLKTRLQQSLRRAVQFSLAHAGSVYTERSVKVSSLSSLLFF